MEKQQSKRRFTGIIEKIVLYGLIVVCLLVLGWIYIAAPIKIFGKSMEPTFMDRQTVLVDKIALKFSAPKRGEVVVYKFTGTDFIGRIVGLPGEDVEIQRGSVVINGDKITELYAHWENFNVAHPTDFKLKGDEYLILNDNRNSLMNVVNVSDLTGVVY